ncbi:hypothetical protein MTO96_009030 [Rhipicephalus appendiculatus]
MRPAWGPLEMSHGQMFYTLAVYYNCPFDSTPQEVVQFNEALVYPGDFASVFRCPGRIRRWRRGLALADWTPPAAAAQGLTTVDGQDCEEPWTRFTVEWYTFDWYNWRVPIPWFRYHDSAPQVRVVERNPQGGPTAALAFAASLAFTYLVLRLSEWQRGIALPPAAVWNQDEVDGKIS